jgi:hypothetical protein
MGEPLGCTVTAKAVPSLQWAKEFAMKWFNVRGYRDASGEQEELAYALVWANNEAHAAELAWQNQGFADAVLINKDEREAINCSWRGAIILVATPA